MGVEVDLTLNLRTTDTVVWVDELTGATDNLGETAFLQS